MNFITIKNENGLECTVTSIHPKNYDVIMGGMDIAPTWEQYLSRFNDEYQPHFWLIKKAIEELGWVGDKAGIRANNTCFVFSDKTAIGFTWRAWGDLMSAIVGNREGYMAYYL